mmetsp:Transcript_88748/g.162684  ORF Transcript_88748/g.162684 Transcript_88748/m.162684 type:complete len:446 (+) Transcript_88748:136-1473(+)
MQVQSQDAEGDNTADYFKRSLPRSDVLVTRSQLEGFLIALDNSDSILGDFGRRVLLAAVPTTEDGKIKLADFVDWVYKSEACSLPNKIGDAAELRFFWSGHQTTSFIKYRSQEWGPKVCGKDYDENSLSIKASMPPFNNSLKLALPKTLVEYNVPNYGPNIGNAIMGIFGTDDMRDLSAKVRAPIPRYTLNSFIQGKMTKVHDMIREARKRDDCTGANATAIDKLEEFTKAFQALKTSDMTCLEDWTRFVETYVAKGWEHRLHFDHLMQNFGYEEKSAKELQQTKIIASDGKEVTLETHGFRWLSKAFAAYGPKGCLTDVVNLIFAMGKYIPTETLSDEKQITEFIRDFHGNLNSSAFDKFWVPTHFVHDAEADDMLCWLLLEHVHKRMGTTMEVLVQLPSDESMDRLAEVFEKNERCTVCRDPDSRNCEQVKHAFPDLYPEVNK